MSFSPTYPRIFTELDQYLEPIHQTSVWSRATRSSISGCPDLTHNTYRILHCCRAGSISDLSGPSSKKEAKPICSCVTEDRTEGSYGVKLVLYLRPALGCYGNRNSSHHRGLLQTPLRYPLRSPTLHHSAAACLTLGLKGRGKECATRHRKLFPPEVKSK